MVKVTSIVSLNRAANVSGVVTETLMLLRAGLEIVRSTLVSSILESS